MGPSHDESIEFMQSGQRGSGRKKREIVQGVDINNLIMVKIYYDKYNIKN